MTDGPITNDEPDTLDQLADDLDAAGQPAFAWRARALRDALTPYLLPQLPVATAEDDIELPALERVGVDDEEEA